MPQLYVIFARDQTNNKIIFETELHITSFMGIFTTDLIEGLQSKCHQLLEYSIDLT